MDAPRRPDFRPKAFDPETLLQSVIAMPLRQELEDEQARLLLQDKLARLSKADKHADQPNRASPALRAARKEWKTAGFVEGPARLFSIIIDLNLEYPDGRAGAMKWVLDTLAELVPTLTREPDHIAVSLRAADDPKNRYTQQYLFVKVESDVVLELVKRDRQQERKAGVLPADSTMQTGPRAIYHVWADFKIYALLNKSISTVKGDAAHAAYAAFGDGIVWAVMDSGIDETHPHFATHKNLEVDSPLEHTDFTGAAPGPNGASAAVRDEAGHGTHVAGIIGGMWGDTSRPPTVYTRQRDDGGAINLVPVVTNTMSGMATKCKLLSLKVLDENGEGEASNVIAAIGMIQELNGYGRHLLVHGVNMSVGYSFNPEWFACGQSPICVEVNRLVRSGVVVVAAAGNTGYGSAQSEFNGVVSAGLPFTINDPGNAELAITVGSTHREMPHTYGVSYFSSKGPTGDGRLKPDLVAPGEKILSCAAGAILQEMKDQGKPCDYAEDSGTSMAAPHVSGAVAAFLSIRREFIGRPEQVKEIFMSTATDLKREKYFQGSGLVDLMRAIQSV
ncbi:S8 family serine peptidase [Hymenobacter terrenus]|uniref:S8 family serine peptidase n=1 Tax=Hymenobacter terrenus TaxID=1629124 RepID=UPI0006198EE5|nr:S8 family serine peptidase [Hymenobacter terrenus]